MSSKGKPYRTVDVEGWEVLVGRADEDNDYLTFGVAQKRDLWLHVAGATPGSHVVVRNPTGDDVPQDVIAKAAQLAAWFSKARGAPNVEVHFCRVADVIKPRGAPRGQVQIRRFKRIKVQPSRLHATED
ncbi:MAG: NFACT RNA binding domain-containing protein [Burkholderiaceae bacterium]|jgi:predicted ribosome quality control (RQC) complex YloA/Tae2 family protein|nr:NFACT RNA binding domain-containing protein [Burkholderiaceae bacterium]